MHWIVGLDLLDLSSGALRLASWLRKRAPEASFSGVHVLTSHPLRHSLSDKTEDELRVWVQELAEKSVDQAGVAAELSDVSVVEASSAEEGLAAALEAASGSALIIGRKAKSDSEKVIRLGRVARRLLRRMPAPIAVVPPDLGAELAPGPVVLATDLGPSSESALDFAVELASTVGRDLLIVHAFSVHSALEVYIAPSAWDRASFEASAQAEASVLAWRERHQLTARSLVVRGPTVHGVLETCAREQACMIVAGTRRLSFLDRIFTSSVGGDLAALAPIPVIIVPAEPPAEAAP